MLLDESQMALLSRHPAPALPLPLPPREVPVALLGIPPEDLRASAARFPGYVRVVDLWGEEWRTLAPAPDVLPPELAQAFRGTGYERRWWVVPLGQAPENPGEREAVRILRESVRHLGRTLQVEARGDRIRWRALIRETRRVLAREVPRLGIPGRGETGATGTASPA